MKKYIVIIIALFLSSYIFGCAKKEAPLEELQEPMSAETLSTLKTQSPTTEAKPQAGTPSMLTVGAPASTTGPALAPLPPAGPYQPTVKEIQTALKNAGYYTGSIDGIKGKMTKKATEDFQKANGLQADGKVGTKTWAVLSKYKDMAPVSAAPVSQ